MYAYKVEPEAQRPLDSASEGLWYNLFVSFGWPLEDSAVRSGEQVRFAGICCSPGYTRVGALSRVIIVVEGHLQFSCAVRR